MFTKYLTTISYSSNAISMLKSRWHSITLLNIDKDNYVLNKKKIKIFQSKSLLSIFQTLHFFKLNLTKNRKEIKTREKITPIL